MSSSRASKRNAGRRMHSPGSATAFVALLGLWLVACVPGGGGGGGSGSDGGGEVDLAGPDVGCLPACDDRRCGDDGCGAPCGACDEGAVCSIDGDCVDVAATCGDGACADGEDCATCPADCGQCCGNGACESSQGETCATCAADCPCAEGTACAVEARRCVPSAVDAGRLDGGSGDADGGDLGLDAGATPDAGSAGPPRILTLNTNRRTLTEGQRLIVSAVVTDPDGIADVIGGVLESPAGASYGAFSTAGEEGAYSLTLTWDDLHAVAVIDFAQGEDELRRLEAVFYDQGGDSVRQALEVTLTCDGAGACDGVCTDLTSTADCGACGNDCGDAVPGVACEAGRCRCPAGAGLCDGRCVDLGTPDDCGACGRACAPGVACIGGDCVCEGACRVPRAGDLAVTEFLADPAAVTDTNGEWFEVSNVSGRPLTLDGVVFGNPDAFAADGPDSVRVFGLELPPEGRLVFGKRGDPMVNGGVAVDVAFATLSLRNTDDVLAIADDSGRELYVLRYAMPAAVEPGASWQLDPGVDPTAGGLQFPRGWCPSAMAWPGGQGDRGSPGAANAACP